MYGNRVKYLCVTAPFAEIAVGMDDEVKLLARAMTGTMPRFKAFIVPTILKDEHLKEVWDAI